MSDLAAAFGPYFPPAIILLQIILWMRVENLMGKFKLWAVDRFVTKRGYAGK